MLSDTLRLTGLHLNVYYNRFDLYMENSVVSNTKDKMQVEKSYLTSKLQNIFSQSIEMVVKTINDREGVHICDTIYWS